MKLCLLFHCLCESYDEVPQYGQELYVSVADMRVMIDQLLDRGYRFSSAEDTSDKTVTITFDDGYYNNLLFSEISRSYDIPYVIFVSAYYLRTGETFPWLSDNCKNYSQIHDFDYYRHFGDDRAIQVKSSPGPLERPMTFKELEELINSDKAEVGCHGYYHQPLSRKFEGYLKQEQELALSVLYEHLGIKPRYYGLANGLYTKGVVRELLKTFDRVFTVEGRPYNPGDRVIHRYSLINPNVGGPLVYQIDRHTGRLRQIKRAARTFRRLRF